YRELPCLQVEDRDLRRRRRLQHLQAALGRRGLGPYLVRALVVRVRLWAHDRRRRQDDADGKPHRARAFQGWLRPGRRLLPAPEDLYAKWSRRRIRIQVVPRTSEDGRQGISGSGSFALNPSADPDLSAQ